MNILLTFLSDIIYPDIEIYMSYSFYDRYHFYHREYQDINGKFDRIFGPAYITYWSNSKQPETIIWYQHGTKHRIGGPAYIEYTSRGVPLNKIWYQNGMRHRLDGPAVINYSGEKISEEKWYQNDHRINKNLK